MTLGQAFSSSAFCGAPPFIARPKPPPRRSASPLPLSAAGYIGEFEIVDDHRAGKIVSACPHTPVRGGGGGEGGASGVPLTPRRERPWRTMASS